MSEGQIVVADEQKMLEKMLDLPNQLERAWTANWVRNLPVTAESFDKVIIAGMGGSGIAGALMIDLFGEKMSQPVAVWADYGLPGWANDRTLLIAVSFSGATEETLDAVNTAVGRKLPVLAISSGGQLEKLSSIHGFPMLKIEYPGSPRSALGYLYGALLTAAVKMRLIDLSEKTYFQAVEALKKTIAQKTFPPKAEWLAVQLNNKVPIIMAYRPLFAVAKRYQNQLNENSKTFASAVALPEACHNVVVGTEFAVSEKLLILLLESRYGFSRNVAHKKALEKMFVAREIPMMPLGVKSDSALLEQLLFLHFGDLLSYYLAGVYGVDPSPTEAIELMKSEMKKL